MSRAAVCAVDRWQLTVAQAKAGGRLALVKAAAESEQRRPHADERLRRWCAVGVLASRAGIQSASKPV